MCIMTIQYYRQSNGQNTQVGELPGGVAVYAACIEKGVEQLRGIDVYIEHQSYFDQQARTSLQFDGDRQRLQALYLNYIGNQVLAWSDDEILGLKQIAASIGQKYQAFSYPLPKEIYLVKTTGQEEGGGAYTRQLNTIVLPISMVASLASAAQGDALHPASNTTALENIIMHETFHIFYKNAYLDDRERVAALFAKIHYAFTDHEVPLPNVPWPKPGSPTMMPEMKITNPDEPRQNVYIEMQVGEQEGGKAALMPVLMAKAPYRGGSFFSYLDWYMMEIRKQPSTGQWQPVLQDGRPVCHLIPGGDPSSSPLWRQYLDLVGGNTTEEIFQPGEILAQNFVLAANIPSLWVLQDIQMLLGRHA